MTPRQGELLRLLQRNPDGISLLELITLSGGTQYSTVSDLRALKDLRLVAPSNSTGRGVVWATADNLLAIKAKNAAVRAELAAAAKERATRREQSAQDRASEEAACEAFSGPPVHRTLQQHEWVGRPHRGVASVFHMGSSLA